MEEEREETGHEAEAEESESPETEAAEAGPGEEPTRAETGEAAELTELKDKYLRIYAEFENYKKRVAKDREELIKFSNESLIFELLTSLDNLEIAIQHAEDGSAEGLVEGVRNTLRGFYRTLEKFGLRHIEAEGRPFDPEVHHAISQVERDDIDEKMVVEELRKGFMYNDRVLRASLVSVSTRPSGGEAGEGEEAAGISKKSEEEK